MERVIRWRLEGFLVLLAGVETASVLTGESQHRAAEAVVAAASALVLVGRRWRPLAATLVAFSALTVSLAIVPRSTSAQFFGTLATFALAGALDDGTDAVIAWCAGAAMLAYAAFVDPFGGGVADFLLSLAFGSCMWAAGWLVHRHRRQSEAMARVARLAEAAQHELARHAVLDERARIARELHDVVSHGLSVIVLQSQAARLSLEDGGSPREHLSAVEDTAREALGEMRRMLGLLQADDLVGGSVAPAPGLRNLPQLVESARSAGLEPRAVELPDGVTLPAGLELAVYRVVQESVTNAVKHAPGAWLEVSVTCPAGRAVVEVRNGPARTSVVDVPGGHGLVGMRERVAVYDGTLDVGPCEDGFRVHAVFPVREHAVELQGQP